MSYDTKGHREMEPGTEAIWQALHEIADPEFPVSLVEMGLIYKVKKVGRKAFIEMTFTSMGCPCMEMIITDIKNKLLQLRDIDAVEIEIVWDPPWTPAQLAPEAVEQLAVWGVSV